MRVEAELPGAQLVQVYADGAELFIKNELSQIFAKVGFQGDELFFKYDEALILDIV